MGRQQRRQPWTPQQDKWLRELYPETSNRQIARMMGRKYSSIKNRGQALGLKKSPAYLEREKPGCFKPGQPTWNKGISYQPGGRIKEGQFRKGQQPHNTMKVGAIRETKDGILQQKVTDTGYPPKDWRSLHVIRWEEHHGRPVPPGHIVRFRDGNRRNFDDDNLVLVSRAENAVMNKMYQANDLPPEGFDVMLNLARLKITEKRRKRETEGA